MNQVKNPTEKIIYMDESERTVNNGEYNPTVVLADVDDNTKDYSAVAERHEMKSKRNSQNASGNVAFADGHAEFLSRKQAFERKHEERMKKHEARMEEHFKALDTDGDGAVSEAEMQAHHGQMFSKLDADGDGFVTEEELKAHKKSHMEHKGEGDKPASE